MSMITPSLQNGLAWIVIMFLCGCAYFRYIFRQKRGCVIMAQNICALTVRRARRPPITYYLNLTVYVLANYLAIY